MVEVDGQLPPKTRPGRTGPDDQAGGESPVFEIKGLEYHGVGVAMMVVHVGPDHVQNMTYVLRAHQFRYYQGPVPIPDIARHVPGRFDRQ